MSHSGGHAGRAYRVEASRNLSTCQIVGSVQAAPDGQGAFLDTAPVSAYGAARFLSLRLDRESGGREFPGLCARFAPRNFRAPFGVHALACSGGSGT